MAFKILVNSEFGGGAEIQAALLARALKPDAFLVLDGAGETATDSLSPDYAALPPAVKTLMLPHYARRLAARAGPGDTVLSFMQRSNFVNVLAARKSGHRAVICEVTQPSREFTGLRGALVKPLIRLLYPRAALTLSNSKGNARDLEENFGFPPGRIKVIYNSCDTAEVERMAAEPLGSYSVFFMRPVIITSGRLTAAKGHWHLLRIFAEVKKSNPEAALVFLGLTVYDAKSSGVMPGGEDVFFAGFQLNPYKFLARARVFAFTSLWEGLPNAVIEALACGLPVLSADCRSGPRELLAPYGDFTAAAAAPEATATGFLLPPFPVAPPDFSTRTDALELLWAQKLSELLADAPRLASMAAAARKRAEAFSLAAKIPEWRSALGI